MVTPTTLPTNRTNPANWKQVRDRFLSLPQEIRDHFVHYPRLLNEFPWKVSMAYLFAELEAAHRMTIYCGIVKLHRVDAAMTWAAIDSWRMRREEFAKTLETVFDKKVPSSTAAALTDAERVRDKIVHGATVSDAQHRTGQVRAFDYIEGLDAFLPSVGGSSPFRDLRGFKGATQPLTKQTSRWVLKGLGFAV